MINRLKHGDLQDVGDSDGERDTLIAVHSRDSSFKM